VEGFSTFVDVTIYLIDDTSHILRKWA